MRNWFLALMLASVAGLLTGCEQPARPKRPPADASSEETADDFRSRRRNGSVSEDERDVPEDRYADERPREERLRPDSGRRESSAAEDAEDERDAAADRPTKPQDE